ncbi:hypothetical protein AB3Y40_01055 [Yoonia sp. R2331]|uniref:hypothetical protein n=1 Tax=Yoonia sp. R2331 TaxID=3237238 RepID=UPI0034E5D66E
MKAVLSRPPKTHVTHLTSPQVQRYSKPGHTVLILFLAALMLLASLILADGGGPLFALGALATVILAICAAVALLRQTRAHLAALLARHRAPSG